MLEIVIPEMECYNEETSEFIKVKETKLKLEHSLVSLKKWEEKWKVPFLHTQMTIEQQFDYVRCMTITQNVDPNIYQFIPRSVMAKINDYINDSHTATKIYDNSPKKPGRKEIITAEIIYYWMVSFNIPAEYQKWNLSQLLALIEVCSIKNSPKKNMSKSSILRQNNKLNAARRKAYNSMG